MFAKDDFYRTGSNKSEVSAFANTDVVKPTLEEITAYFTDRIGDTQDPRSWPADKIKTQSSKFFNHYEANGWVQKQGKPIVDWKAASRNWIQNELEHVFSPSPPPAMNGTKIHTPPEKRSPTLTTMQQDFNYLYETYLDGKCTILSMDVNYYDYAKQNKMISFTDQEIEDIKAKALINLKELAIPNTEHTMKAIMKKEGLLQFFKQLKEAGRSCVFSLQEQPT